MSHVLRFCAACGILLAASCLLPGRAAEPAGNAPPKAWYIAPTGNDDAPGSRENPFATLARAQQAVSPGDTVYLRGGKYLFQESQIVQSRGVFARVIVLEKSGTRDKPITYRAYED